MGILENTYASAREHFESLTDWIELSWLIFTPSGTSSYQTDMVDFLFINIYFPPVWLEEVGNHSCVICLMPNCSPPFALHHRHYTTWNLLNMVVFKHTLQWYLNCSNCLCYLLENSGWIIQLYLFCSFIYSIIVFCTICCKTLLHIDC